MKRCWLKQGEKANALVLYINACNIRFKLLEPFTGAGKRNVTIVGVTETSTCDRDYVLQDMTGKVTTDW